VASTADGIPEAPGNGEAGLLSPVGDAAALAGHLQAVLTDPELAERLRRSALQAARTFTVERMSEDYLHLYRHLS
jgi:phosphatidylinositol alpha-mannosyltransferase